MSIAAELLQRHIQTLVDDHQHCLGSDLEVIEVSAETWLDIDGDTVNVE